MKPVSIIILNWNDYEDTAECLVSLQSQDYPNYRIYVVDNGSTDGSFAKIKEDYPGVVLIRNHKNLGFAEGTNIGIRKALKSKTEYILLLNNDTIIDKKALTKMVQASESDERIGVVGATIYHYYQPHIIESTGTNINQRTGRIYHPGYGHIKKDNKPLAEVDAVSGCAMLVKRKVVEEVGWLEPDFFCYVEDIDWCLRIRKAGYKVATALGAKVWHKGGRASGGYASPLRIYYGVRNQLLAFNKNFPIKNPALRTIRNLSIIALYLAHVLLTSKVKAKEGLPALIKGIQDFFAGRLGQSRI